MNTPASRQRFPSLHRSAIRCALAALLTAGALAACSDDGDSKSDKLAEELIDQAAAERDEESSGDDQFVTVPDIGGGQQDANVDASSPNAGSDTAAPSDNETQTTLPTVKQQIDKTVWWGGFTITVSSAEGSSNALSATINISIELENRTTEVARLNREDIVLTVGTQSYLAGLGQTPDVPPNSRNDVILDFLVDDSFVIDDAVLTFGQPDGNQAVVPFGSNAATSFEPKELTANAMLVTSTETIQVTVGMLDASYAPGERDVYIVRLPIRATYTGGSAGGDLILPTQFALRSPDGTSVVGNPIAPGDVVAEPVYPGQDLTGKVIAFKVSTAEAGTWTITYTDGLGESATADFSVA